MKWIILFSTEILEPAKLVYIVPQRYINDDTQKF